MNYKIRRSIAAVIAAAAVFTPLSSVPVLSDLSTVSLTASASSYHLSGYKHSEFYVKSADNSYTLYFNVKDSKAKTAVVYGCFTTQPNVSINIPETARWMGVDYTITEIGDFAFDEQENINSVTMPKTITKIGDSAFIDCSNLTSVNAVSIIPGVQEYLLNEIGDEAFSGCEKLRSLIFVLKATHIGENAFDRCISVENVTLTALTSMGREAFARCDSLYDIDMSKASLTEIPDRAFQNCGWTMNSCYDFNIALPSTVTSIGNEAFYNVNRLRKIDLYNVTSIGRSAFEDCHSLKTVYTSDDLSYIGEQAFYGCDPMTYFVCKNPNAVIGKKAIGYAHQRNFTGKKSNFTVWGSKGGGNVKAYADNTENRFTYKNTEDAANEAIANFKDYMWNTDNWTPNCKEMLADSKGNYLFINGHKPYVDNNKLTEKFDGSCGGLAAVSALTYNGYLTVDQFAPGYSKIKDIKENCPEFTKSFINTVWANISKTDTTLSYNNIVPKLTKADDDMLKYIEYITYGEDVAMILRGESPQDPKTHAVVCLGMEYIENNEKGMDRRILIYDVNNKSFKDNFCFYFNSKTGEWYVPSGYSSEKNPDFCLSLFTTPQTMVSRDSLSGMDFVNTLLGIRQ